MEDLKKLPFDLYTRNRIIAELVSTIRKNEPLKILDVGGRNGRLNLFLPTDEIYQLDLLSAELDMGNYIQGDIRKAPIIDHSFDIVVSSDLFEHISPEDRKEVILQMIRASKNYVILGAPFYSPEVADAEKKANNYFFHNKGESHPWLREHISNGLPLGPQFEQQLIDLDYEFLVIHSNNIDNWLLMQFFIFTAYIHGISEKYVNDVYEYYNSHYQTLGDNKEPTYRKIYLIGKRGTLPVIDLKTSRISVIDPFHYEELLCRIFNGITDVTTQKNILINNLQSTLELRNLDIHTKQTEVSRLVSEVNAKDSEVSRRVSEVNAKDSEVSRLVSEVNVKDSTIISLNSTLNSIYLSTTWTLMQKFQKGIDILLPQGKRRRTLYDNFILGLRMIVHNEWRTLWFEIKKRASQKLSPSQNITHVPINEIKLKELAGNIPFSLHQPLKGSFVFPINQLNEISIFTATYNRKNSDLILLLKEESLNNPAIRSVRLPESKILDNDFSVFKFSPILNSAGKRYYFELYSTGSPAAAVWLNPNQTFIQVQLLDDDGPVNGIIGFKCFSKLTIRDPYELWILKSEPDQRALTEFKTGCIPQFTYLPKISIITPVWNTDEQWLRLAIESVINQVYENWDLCLVDGGSTKPHIKQVLNEYAQKDSRIKVKLLGENLGIAGNSNEALALATGEFIGFLDHDDELAPFALYEIIKLLNQNQNADFIYSDEDKIDSSGKRKDPFFKPDWSPDLFLSCNYICHFSVTRKVLLDSVGGFRQGYDGSQDYDLFLRLTERCSKNDIFHIPQILYHWRIIPQSAASSTTAKLYAYDAAKRALSDAMKRRHIPVEGIYDGYGLGYYKIKYKLIGTPKVSIIILTKNNGISLSRCIASIIQKTTFSNFEILIVDNESDEKKTLDYYIQIQSDPRVKILRYPQLFNISAMNNFAVSQSESPYLIFLKDSAEIISEDWLSLMLEYAQQDAVGVVGAKIIKPDNTVESAGLILGITTKGNHEQNIGYSHRAYPQDHPGYFLTLQTIRNTSAVSGVCMMVKRDLVILFGGFDEHLSMAYMDVDLCLKIREQGYSVIYNPYVHICHPESGKPEKVSDKAQEYTNNIKYFSETWDAVINKGDPYYNPNLTLEKEDFSINL